MARKNKKRDNGTNADRYGAFMQKVAKTLETTSKQLVWLFSINGILWIWCSYFLAFIGRDTIAETLSSNVCTVVIGQMGFYLVSKTVENVFRYNDIFAKRKLNIDIPEAPSTPTPNFTTPIVDCMEETVIKFNEPEDNIYESAECSVDPAALD